MEIAQKFHHMQKIFREFQGAAFSLQYRIKRFFLTFSEKGIPEEFTSSNSIENCCESLSACSDLKNIDKTTG